MHTSSGVDAVDEYLETVAKKGDRYVYKYGGGERPVVAKAIDGCRTRPSMEWRRRSSRCTARSMGR